MEPIIPCHSGPGHAVGIQEYKGDIIIRCSCMKLLEQTGQKEKRDASYSPPQYTNPLTYTQSGSYQ